MGTIYSDFGISITRSTTAKSEYFVLDVSGGIEVFAGIESENF